MIKFYICTIKCCEGANIEENVMGVSCRTHGEDEELLIGKPKGNISLCRFKRRKQDNIKIVIKEIDVAVDSCVILAFVWGKILKTVLNFQLS